MPSVGARGAAPGAVGDDGAVGDGAIRDAPDTGTPEAVSDAGVPAAGVSAGAGSDDERRPRFLQAWMSAWVRCLNSGEGLPSFK